MTKIVNPFPYYNADVPVDLSRRNPGWLDTYSATVGTYARPIMDATVEKVQFGHLQFDEEFDIISAIDESPFSQRNAIHLLKAKNKEHFDFLLANLEENQERRNVIEDSSFLPYLVSEALNPLNILFAIPAIRVGALAYLGKESLVRAGLIGAQQGLIAGVTAEAIRYPFDPLETPIEATANIVGNTALGGLLGVGVPATFRALFHTLPKRGQQMVPEAARFERTQERFQRGGTGDEVDGIKIVETEMDAPDVPTSEFRDNAVRINIDKVQEEFIDFKYMDRNVSGGSGLGRFAFDDVEMYSDFLIHKQVLQQISPKNYQPKELKRRKNETDEKFAQRTEQEKIRVADKLNQDAIARAADGYGLKETFYSRINPFAGPSQRVARNPNQPEGVKRYLSLLNGNNIMALKRNTAGFGTNGVEQQIGKFTARATKTYNELERQFVMQIKEREAVQIPILGFKPEEYLSRPKDMREWERGRFSSYIDLDPRINDSIPKEQKQFNKTIQDFFGDFLTQAQDEGLLLGIENYDIKLRDLNSQLKRQERILDELEKSIEATPKSTEPKSKIIHFTLPENIESIITEGFDTSKPPIHGMGNRDTRVKTGKLDKDVLYFTTDKEQWGSAKIYVGENKGDTDASFYNYNLNQWETEKNAYKLVNLKGIEAGIKDSARVLTLDSMDKIKSYVPDAYLEGAIQSVLRKAKKDGYDVVNVKFENVTKWGTSKFDYDKATLGSGKDDYFIINKDSIEIDTTQFDINRIKSKIQELKEGPDGIIALQDAKESALPANSYRVPRFYQVGLLKKGKANDDAYYNKFRNLLINEFTENPINFKFNNSTGVMEPYKSNPAAEADEVIANIINENNMAFGFTTRAKNTKHLRRRALNIPDRKLKEFLILDSSILEKYARSMGYRIAWQRNFGNQTKDDVLNSIERIIEDDASIETKLKPKLIIQAKKAFEGDYLRMLGIHMGDPHLWDNQIAKIATDSAAIVRLAGSGITTIGDLANVHAARSSRQYIMGMMSEGRKLIDNVDDLQEFVEVLQPGPQFVRDQLFNDSRSGIEPSFADKLMHYPNQIMFNLPIIGNDLLLGTQVTRKIAATGNINDILKLVEKARTGKLSDLETQQAGTLGLNPRILEILSEMPTQTSESGKVIYANTKEWDLSQPKVRMAFDALIDATEKASNGQILLAKNFDKPLIMDGVLFVKYHPAMKYLGITPDPNVSYQGVKYARIKRGVGFFKMPFQFMNYSFAANTSVVGRSFDPIQERRLQHIAMSLALSALILQIQKPWVWNLSSQDIALRVVDRSGITGVYSDLLYEGIHMFAAAGGDPEQLPFKTKYKVEADEVFDVGLGAAPTLIRDLAKAAYEYSEDQSTANARELSRQLPRINFFPNFGGGSADFELFHDIVVK